MKKFWRSGMIDKKIVREREQEEYINRLNRTILELRMEPPQPEPCCCRKHSCNYKRFNRSAINEWLYEQLQKRQRYDNYKGVD